MLPVWHSRLKIDELCRELSVTKPEHTSPGHYFLDITFWAPRLSFALTMDFPFLRFR